MMTYAYHALEINNVWRLFLFATIMALAYMPGILIAYEFLIKRRIQENLNGFDKSINVR